jgi:hypothetical protein
MAFPIDAPIEHLGDTHFRPACPPDIAEKKCGKRAKKQLAKAEFFVSLYGMGVVNPLSTVAAL